MSADNIAAPAPRDRITDTTLPSKQDQFDVFQDYRNGGPDLIQPKAPVSDQIQPRVTNTSVDKVESKSVPDVSIVSGRDAVYTVKPGDNLWNIANRYLSEQRKTATGDDANKPVTPREINDLVGKIFEANKGNGKDQIKHRDRIYPNQHLTIPGFGAPEAPKPAETPKAPVKAAETPQVPAKPAETPQHPVLETPQVPAKPAETPQVPAKQPEVTTNPTEAENPKPVEARTETPVQAPVENFAPPNGSNENPTIGAEVAGKEAETLLRHFDQIPGKADPAYVDANALDTYIKSNTNLSAEDKRWLTSAASHLGRIQKSSNDEWGRETSGATRADLEAYPRQERAFEEQYTARNYIKTNFDNMAGTDGILNISELRAWTQKRTSEKASPQELKVLADADKLMRDNHVSINYRGVPKNRVGINLLPRVVENGSRYWYGDFAQ